jgi:protoporphyrinogen oxidase
MNQQRAIIIGAGPAGLTAAYELLTRSGIKPIVLEKSGYMGGISRTVNYKGNRIDIGGHRFFSKSDRVMKMGSSPKSVISVRLAAAAERSSDRWLQ